MDIIPGNDQTDLDKIESDLDAVQQALEELDANDLDRAEALVAGLDPSGGESSTEDIANEA